MKKSLIVSIVVCISLSGYAQETPRVKEAGLIFGGLNSFGLTYRQGNTKSLWRFTALSANGNRLNQNSDTADIKNSIDNFTFSFGKEFRKSIADNFQFRFGADISFNYLKDTRSEIGKISNYSTSSKTISYEPGVNLVLGLNYKVKSIVFGAEVLPYYRYSIGKQTVRNNAEQTKSNISGSRYGLSSGSALLSIVYQF